MVLLGPRHGPRCAASAAARPHAGRGHRNVSPAAPAGTAAALPRPGRPRQRGDQPRVQVVTHMVEIKNIFYRFCFVLSLCVYFFTFFF